MAAKIQNVLMPGRSRVTAPVDRADLWLWNLPHYRVVIASGTVPTQFFSRQIIVPGLYIHSYKLNATDVYIGQSNVSGNTSLIETLSPGESLAIEPDEDTEDFSGTITAPDGQKSVIEFGHPIELIDAAQLWGIPANGAFAATLFVTLYLRGGTP